MKNFTCYNKNRTDCKAASGGVTILIKNNIYSKEIKLNTEVEAIAVKITLNNRSITICNIYLSNRYDINTASIEQIINQLPKPHIILGDFNRHNTLWGSYKVDKRGKTIEEILLNHDIVLLNDSSPTHFNSPNATNSAIDLTLCSSNIANQLEWYTLKYLYGSDHYPLITQITHDNNPTDSHISRWKIDKANWTEFKEIISQHMNELDTIVENSINNDTFDIDSIIDRLINIITQAADNSIPKTKGTLQKKKKMFPGGPRSAKKQSKRPRKL